MSPPKGICVECKREVPANHLGVREVRGYADERKGGGPNAIREIQRVDGRIWHSSCFAAWLRKFNDQGEQGGLL